MTDDHPQVPALSAEAQRKELLEVGFAEPPAPWVYVVRVGLAPGTPVEDFRRWYDDTHLPRILAVPGFHWASRYENPGDSPHFLTMYAIDGPEVLESEEYLTLPGWEHWRASLIDWTRSLYRLSDDLGRRGRE